MRLQALPPVVHATVKTTQPCPECGALLEIDPACQIGKIMVPEYPTREVPTVERILRRPAALCPACEFCIEIGTGVTR